MKLKKGTVTERRSYGVTVKGCSDALKRTIEIYRSAVSYCLTVCDENWEAINRREGKHRNNYVEQLIHGKNGNDPVYDFDQRFYKLPSYMRRSAVQYAIGQYRTWKANHDAWVKEPVGKEPKLTLDRNACPALYKGNMYQQLSRYTAKVKVFRNNDWVWMEVGLRKSDCNYLYRKAESFHSEISAPVLQKCHGHYELRFTVKKEVKYVSKPVREQKACAVDLGITTDAVCSVMDSRGTVCARKFISCGSEKDRVNIALHRVSVFQRLHGSHDTRRLWNIAKRRNAHLAIEAARKIVEFAIANDCDVIVFEHLDTKGRKKGSKKQNLHMWKHRDIQNIAERLAHEQGIRISHVCAVNTSRLAYNGSGRVLRGWEVSKDTPYDVCMFPGGKYYNTDLNASYNVGARYFIRDLLKESGDLKAEVPKIPGGSQRVLSDLWTLNRIMDQMGL